ncbi:hypothetical protein F4776DRAFT_662619 [Hypoxylon sp. NC0597]|nr:hypothetical protein F4776DRAFT_662619 [Hypoxylon sp. NC0597]
MASEYSEMDVLRAIYEGIISLLATIGFAATLVVAHLLEIFNIYYPEMQLFLHSTYTGENRPVVSGLKFAVAYFGSRPFVVECCGSVIFALILCEMASGLTHVMPWLLFLMVLGQMGSHAVGILGDPVRAILSDRCDQLARAYRLDRRRVDVAGPQEPRQNVCTKVVVYLADLAHVSFAAASWEDVLDEEVEQDDTLGSQPETDQALPQDASVDDHDLDSERSDPPWGKVIRDESVEDFFEFPTCGL